MAHSVYGIKPQTPFRDYMTWLAIVDDTGDSA